MANINSDLYKSVHLSPNNQVVVRLNDLHNLKSPQICLSLNDNSTNAKEMDNKTVLLSNECKCCELMRRINLAKDIAISRLSEDRDQLKHKLTDARNENLLLKRFSADKQSETNWKEKCEQLEAINKHLRQHLNTLKKVFNELHNSSESTNKTTTTTDTTTSNVCDPNSVCTPITSYDNNITNTITIDNMGANDDCNTTESKSVFEKWYNK